MRPPKRDDCQQKSLLWIRISCDINLPDVFYSGDIFVFFFLFFFAAPALQISPNHCVKFQHVLIGQQVNIFPPIHF